MQNLQRVMMTMFWLELFQESVRIRGKKPTQEHKNTRQTLQIVKEKTVLFLSFLCPPGSNAEAESYKIHTSTQCCSEHIRPAVKGHPRDRNGQRAGELSEQFN